VSVPSTDLPFIYPLHHYDDSDFETETDLPPLDAVISKDILKKMKPKEKKRQDVINGTSLLRSCVSYDLSIAVCTMKDLFILLCGKLESGMTINYIMLFYPAKLSCIQWLVSLGNTKELSVF